jgi:hypothetical protein
VAASLPVAGAVEAAGRPVGHPRTREEWEAAAAAFRAAEAEVRAFERFSSGRPYEEQGALEDKYGDLGDAMYDALRRLLRVPAPDLAALAAKIELIVDHEVGTLTGGEACMAALKRDARRLARA